MRNVVLKIMNVLSVFIIAISIMALLTVVLAKPGEAPNFFGYSLFRVMTGSMEPGIGVDSLIVVKRTAADELQEGDVITFYSRDPSLMGEPNTHRIIRFAEDGGKKLIYTKGDANNIEDRYPVHEEDLIGRVTFVSQRLGKFVRVVSNPIVFIPLIIIPLVFLLIRSIYDGIVSAKKLAKEEEEAAVREALAQLREKRKAQAGENTVAGKGENEENDKAQSNGEETERIRSVAQTPGKMNTRLALGTNDGGRTSKEKRYVQGAGDARRWRNRYGVRQRSQKRNNLNGNKWG